MFTTGLTPGPCPGLKCSPFLKVHTTFVCLCLLNHNVPVYGNPRHQGNLREVVADPETNLKWLKM